MYPRSQSYSKAAIGFAQPTKHPIANSMAQRWGSPHLFEEGFVGVPVAYLKRYARLGLSLGEAVFVLELMSFKWNDQAPFPSYKTLAERMGVTDERARQYAKSLEGKGLLRRIPRKGRSNAFDLLPLAEALDALLQAPAVAA